MQDFLKAFGEVVDRIGQAEKSIVTLLLVIIVTCIFGQVISRYAFGLPLVWVEELSTYAFIWCVFLGASLGLKQNRHIKILSFVSRLSRRRQLLFRGSMDGVIFAFCLLLGVNGFKAMTLFEWNQRTIALPIELPRFLFYSFPLILGAFSMALTTAHDFLVVFTGGEGSVSPKEHMAS